MISVQIGGRSLDDNQRAALVDLPCATLATLMRVQLRPSSDLRAGLAKLDEARNYFMRAAARSADRADLYIFPREAKP